VYGYIYIYIYKCIFIYIYIYIYTCIHIHIHIFTNTCMQIHVHIHSLCVSLSSNKPKNTRLAALYNSNSHTYTHILHTHSLCKSLLSHKTKYTRLAAACAHTHTHTYTIHLQSLCISPLTKNQAHMPFCYTKYIFTHTYVLNKYTVFVYLSSHTNPSTHAWLLHVPCSRWATKATSWKIAW
jgi:hypothetical protein